MGEIRDSWKEGNPYEYFMGRWSSLMAYEFIKWLDMPANLRWLDIGCGTGALSAAIEQNCIPQSISCMDPSKGFIEMAKNRLSKKCEFKVGKAESLPFANESFHTVVSGLALNFFPNLDISLSEMQRVLKPNGCIAAYVWDYSGRMDFLRYFWDAAYQIDPKSKQYDEGLRFPICNPKKLRNEFNKAGLKNVETSFLDIETGFLDFEDYWNPFLGGQGPAPSYLMSLNKESHDELKEKILERMDYQPDGTINLKGRAIVVRGKK